jgi:hypothetical protein
MAKLGFSFRHAGQITDGRPDRASTPVDKKIIRFNGEIISPNIHGKEKEALDKWALSKGFFIQAIGSENAKDGETRTYVKTIPTALQPIR